MSPLTLCIFEKAGSGGFQSLVVVWHEDREVICTLIRKVRNVVTLGMKLTTFWVIMINGVFSKSGRDLTSIALSLSLSDILIQTQETRNKKPE